MSVVVCDTLPPGLPKAANARPCGSCRHLDGQALPSGVSYCWRFYIWVDPVLVVEDCSGAERATGGDPPSRIRFREDQPK